MKLRHSLPLAFAATMLLVGAAALVAIARLSGALDTYAIEVRAHVADERAVAQLLDTFKVQVQEWKNTLLRGKDAKALDKHWNAFQEQERKVNALARDLAAKLPEADSRQLIEQFAAEHLKMGEAYRKGYQAFVAADHDPAAGDTAVTGVDRAPAKLLADAAAKIAADSAAISAGAAAQAHTAIVASLVLMSLACALGVAGGVLFGRRIAGRLHLVAQSAHAVASGDLAVAISAHGRDEVAELSQALADMKDQLAHIVALVRERAHGVALASGEIATGNNDLSARTEQQASALQEAAASMEQLGSTVRLNAEHASKANQFALDARSVALKGGEVVSKVVTTMRDINDSSQRIADIIGVIDGIAFQTNILALNAAVEAARAGEQGRGFAVVASEVRNLAQRSAAAAKEIKTLISDSVGRVALGSDLVHDAGTTMNEVVDAIRRVTEIMGEISAASGEQSTGVSQVGSAVAQIDQTTQQNAALVEQSAAAAQGLKDQADQLVQSVAVFKLAA